jgi:hypothetical protein
MKLLRGEWRLTPSLSAELHGLKPAHIGCRPLTYTGNGRRRRLLGQRFLGEIIFQIPHTHIDGIGAMLLLNTFLGIIRSLLWKVRFKIEHQNLSNSTAHLLGHRQARSVVIPLTHGRPGY